MTELNLALNLNTILNALAIGGLMHVAKTLWKTTGALERLDERTTAQAARIDALERRVA